MTSIRVIEHYSLPLPPGVAEAILRAGGVNRYGEPAYRLTWGFQALELRGGEHTDYDDSGYPIRTEVRYQSWPRYSPRDNRFHLEVWMPPEFYGTPGSWLEATKKYIRGETVEQLGLYPSRGDYELVATMETPTGEYVEPHADAVADMIRLHLRTRNRTRDEIRAGIAAGLEYQKSERARKYRDILDSEAVAFPWRTWVPVTGKGPRQLYG